MLYLCKLPIEIQYLIMKYLSYSPTSKLIQDNQTIILNKHIYYQYIENRFDIFHTNDTLSTNGDDDVFEERDVFFKSSVNIKGDGVSGEVLFELIMSLTFVEPDETDFFILSTKL